MNAVLLLAADTVAILILTFVLFIPRHRRTDMVVAYMVVNMGTLIVASTLATSQVSAGLGLGIFGVLSIIRLRSEQLDQQEVAYYFAALALGLLGGIDAGRPGMSAALMAGLLVVLYVGDHPRLARHGKRQNITLDRAIFDEDELTWALEELYDTEVGQVRVREVNVVSDTTRVEARLIRKNSKHTSNRRVRARSQA